MTPESSVMRVIRDWFVVERRHREEVYRLKYNVINVTWENFETLRFENWQKKTWFTIVRLNNLKKTHVLINAKWIQKLKKKQYSLLWLCKIHFSVEHYRKPFKMFILTTNDGTLISVDFKPKTVNCFVCKSNRSVLSIVEIVVSICISIAPNDLLKK